MLVFFIHGVATSDDTYADKLKKNLRDEFSKRKRLTPYFYASSWGGLLNKASQLWNFVQQDVYEFQGKYDVNTADIFQYEEYRQFFISEFVGDLFTYLNSKWGCEIRKAVALQLREFLERYPEEDELHIIAHSLGGVILWDILFSDRFSKDDPVHEIRSLIKEFKVFPPERQVSLKSVTTMGAPILLFNLMLDVKPEAIKLFVEKYKEQPFAWVNIIHASDILAYPISASLNINLPTNFFLRDKFISSKSVAKKMVQSLGGLAGLAMAKGLQSAHDSYWKRNRVTRLITANLLREYDAIDSEKPFPRSSIWPRL